MLLPGNIFMDKSKIFYEIICTSYFSFTFAAQIYQKNKLKNETLLQCSFYIYTLAEAFGKLSPHYAINE